MKHIPTTETALRKIKLSAKQLKTQLGIPLSQAQDRAAQDAGYEHFHHATHCATHTERKDEFLGLGHLEFQVESHSSAWPTFDDHGHQRGKVRRFAGEFIAHSQEEALDQVIEALDDLVEAVGGGFGDMGLIPRTGLQKIIKQCQSLTRREPAFLDGYAHWAGALVALGRHNECIETHRPVYDAAVALIPATFKGFVPYYYLANRPFHRLAVNLLLAYYGAGQDAEAQAIAKRMLKWWPNDNIGFRFLLTKPEDSDD